MTRWGRLRPLLWSLLVTTVALYASVRVIQTVYGVPLRADAVRFERPWAALLGLAAIVVLLARGYWLVDAAPRVQVSRAQMLSQMGPGRRTRWRHVLTGLRVAAIALLAIGLMGPQSIHAKARSEVEGIDIVLTLDLSMSMQAGDIEPSRFEAAKEVVDDFIMRRPNDRIGAVIFGREAYTLLPLTTDHQALRGMIRELQLGVIDGRGTAIGNALGVGLNRLRESDAKSKTVILLTDGDSNSGNVAPEQAAEFARTMDVKVFPVLMGQRDDARVQRGVSITGRPLWDRGTFPINPELLKRLAEGTDGQHFRATDRKGLEQSFHAILDRLEKTEMQDAGQTYGELFMAFAGPALGCLVLELLLGGLLLRRWP